ncbi:MAG: PLP-dependent aspartate aminotransferase family protein [Deltaproteobacteria bacterium]|nr:PLP-dependent aspartate aminotransferase family protein [Deltaproteobacteria bacterium]
MKKHTQCVHSGTYMEPTTRGINTPVFTSSSFEYLDRDENVYPRYFNTPNQAAIVKKLCALENAENGLIFSSGMAAISTAVFALVGQGDHIVLQKDIYGGTHHFATAEFDRFGITYDFVSNQLSDIQKVIRENTRIIYIETPSNPLLSITDIRAVADLAGSKNILTIIDNTFASPINQNPIDLGMDIVVHSGTKYIGGHSDICCGVALASANLVERMQTTAANFGGSLNAGTCYLIERSLKTLGIRVERQNENALATAGFLKKNPLISKVYYPGLEDHPGHAIACQQMNGFGGMVSFELNEDKVDPHQFLRNLKMIRPALSLGGVETIICAPVTTSHAKMSAAEREELGITDRLMRLSVGIEDPDDIREDLDQALRACLAGT